MTHNSSSRLIYEGHDEIANVLIKSGAKVTAGEKNGVTLLHLASYSG